MGERQLIWPDDFVSKIICGDCLEVLRQIPDGSIHCCVTSPPYWGLRDYGIGGQIGLENSPEEYVLRLVEVFREVRRVLRKDGTLWLNLGDSYCSDSAIRTKSKEAFLRKGDDNFEEWLAPNRIKSGKQRKCFTQYQGTGLKPKDLCGIPWRVAFALQANGWWLRSDIIWSKPNPMPESARDRPTRSHEYIFLLTKSAKYFFDQEAVREVANYDGRKDTYMKGSQKYSQPAVPGQAAHTFALRGHERWPHKLEDGSYGRNIRSVWTITTKPFEEAHFATFPPELPERCIKAGTSEKGVCPKCGNPWVRIIKQLRSFESGSGKSGNPIIGKQNAIQGGGETLDIRRGPCVSTSTIGWRPSCNCNAGDPIPAIVLDPFVGAGTTCYVAKELRRNYIGIDLKREYCDMAEKRMVQGVL